MEDAVSRTLRALERERRQRLARSSIKDSSLLHTDPPLAVNIIEKSQSSLSGTGEDRSTSILFKNGCTYEGQVRDGLMHGQGKYTWRDGTTYEGGFSNGSISGTGIYFWPNGSCYRGEVLRGLRHGEGVFQCSDGVTCYTGQWHMGKRHGEGRLVYNSAGTSYYDGEWREGWQHGWGKRQYSSGNVYEGQWAAGSRHGHGSMHWYDRGEQYTGEWQHGTQHGEGEHIWYIQQRDNSQFPLCNRYVGQWVDGSRHGQGTFHYASGGQYSGGWLKNQKHGPGRFVLPNGHVLEGEFKDDKMVDSGRGLMRSGGVGNALRPKTPLGSVVGDIDGEYSKGSHTHQFNLSVSPLLSTSLDRDCELKQLHCAILRYLTPLRKAYHTYSQLDHTSEGGQAHQGLLTRMQFWQLLRDCELHTAGVAVADADEAISTAVGGDNGHHAPLLMREFLQSLVFIGHRTFSAKHHGVGESALTSRCLDLLMKNHFLPNACRMTGLYYQSTGHTAIARQYVAPSLAIYTKLVSQNVSDDDTEGGTGPTLRQFLLLLKDCSLLDEKLTAKNVVDILVSQVPLATVDEDYYNMEIPMVFLEFLDCLLDCAVKWYTAQHMSHPDPTTTGGVDGGSDHDQDKDEKQSTSEMALENTEDDEDVDKSQSRAGQLSTPSEQPPSEMGEQPQEDRDQERDEGQEGEREEGEGVRGTPETQSVISSMTQQSVPMEQTNPTSDDLELWGKALHMFFTERLLPQFECHSSS